MEVRGYKIFERDWTCRDKQYTCPGFFEEEGEIELCGKGMHFCKNLIDCFNYYPFNIENKVAEVIACGNIAEGEDKCCTDKLIIVREMQWDEVFKLVNFGENCVGIRNIGSYNTGDANIGSYNRGNRNIGGRNNGNYNVGNYNIGSYNTGNENWGHRNSGCCNDGNYNTGSFNTGYANSGSFNHGQNNTGDWNNCDCSSGCFNTIEQKIYFFNKPSNWTYYDWLNSEACTILYRMPFKNKLTFTFIENMTEEEKLKHPESQIIGGYLRRIDSYEPAKKWWKELQSYNKEAIMNIPNFDAKIFEEITGINVNE